MNSNEAAIEALTTIDDTHRIAVTTLVAGGTHQEAADAAGLARETVSRLAAHHPGFRAAMNAARRAAAEEQIAAVDRLRRRAVEVLDQAMAGDDADPRIALGILRAIPAATLDVPDGPTNAIDILQAETERAAATLEPAPLPYDDDGNIDVLAQLERPVENRAQIAAVQRINAALEAGDS